MRADPLGDREICRVAVRVLQAEADGLLELAQSLNESFAQALRVLDGISGRLVVTGMGKSGHIACKLAATLASTGRPSLFVHPAEASHGDLGMITSQDGVIALSNSGETAELWPIVSYTRRFLIPLVVMTGAPRSTLAAQSDALLQLPVLPEACPLGLAPTTSTTMMLALGDALAVALFERRGFSHQDFQNLHPGGSLGRELLQVSELMHRDSAIPIASPTADMAEVILEMTTKHLGCVGIIDDQQYLIGAITDGDLRRHMNPRLLEQPASAVMSQHPHTIGPQELAVRALGLMNQLSITNLFVLESGRLVGVIHLHDCLRSGLDRGQPQADTAAG